MGNGVVNGWTVCNTRLLHDLPCFYALQETDNWTNFAVDVPGHIVYGCDLGKIVILCSR